MLVVIFWWWQNLQRCLLLLAQECGLVILVLLTPTVKSMWFLQVALWSSWWSSFFECNSPAALKRLSLKALQYNFQSLWAKYPLAVPAQVKIASLIFCRWTQRGSQLRFLDTYHKASRPLGGHHTTLMASEVQIHLKEEAEPWSQCFPSPLLGWMEGRARAGD